MTALGLLIAAAAAGVVYCCGIQIGRCEGFKGGMDAAIAVYEEVIREEATKA